MYGIFRIFSVSGVRLLLAFNFVTIFDAVLCFECLPNRFASNEFTKIKSILGLYFPFPPRDPVYRRSTVINMTRQ